VISASVDGQHYRDHLEALRRGERTGVMRIMRHRMPATCPYYIRMDALNEEWAQRNHGQSLKRLNERGGLSPCEAAAIIERRRYDRMPADAAIALLKPFEWRPEKNGGDIPK